MNRRKKKNQSNHLLNVVHCFLIQCVALSLFSFIFSIEIVYAPRFTHDHISERVITEMKKKRKKNNENQQNAFIEHRERFVNTCMSCVDVFPIHKKSKKKQKINLKRRKISGAIKTAEHSNVYRSIQTLVHIVNGSSLVCHVYLNASFRSYANGLLAVCRNRMRSAIRNDTEQNAKEKKINNKGRKKKKSGRTTNENQELYAHIERGCFIQFDLVDLKT